jgi:hypothetical protein
MLSIRKHFYQFRLSKQKTSINQLSFLYSNKIFNIILVVSKKLNFAHLSGQLNLIRKNHRASTSTPMQETSFTRFVFLLSVNCHKTSERASHHCCLNVSSVYILQLFCWLQIRLCCTTTNGGQPDLFSSSTSHSQCLWLFCFIGVMRGFCKFPLEFLTIFCLFTGFIVWTMPYNYIWCQANDLSLSIIFHFSGRH